MKQCIDCRYNKPITEFYKNSKSKDGHGRYCKSCMAIRYIDARHKKIDHYKQVQNNRLLNTTKQFRDWKSQQGCLLCNETEPYCLDMHHLDPSMKEATVSSLTSSGWKKLMTEASKCVIVCANCHRKIHAGLICLISK